MSRYPNTMAFINRENLRRFGYRYGFWLFMAALLILVIMMVIFIKPTPRPADAPPTPIQKLVYGPDMALRAQVERSNGVLVCPNGTIVGLDPATGLYVFFGGPSKWQGNLAPGVTPEQFCAVQRSNG